MAFQTLREQIISQQIETYLFYDHPKQNIDSLSFSNYPEDQKEALIQFYKKVKYLLEQNSFLERLRIKEDSIRSYPMKRIYSSLTPITHLRVLYKWLNVEDENESIDKISNAQEFLIANWEEKDFFPFLPLKLSHSVLNILSTRNIICRLSSTIPFCISFTYAKEIDGLLCTRHFRMYFDPKTKVIVPYSKRKSAVPHRLSGTTIAQIKEKLKTYVHAV